MQRQALEVGYEERADGTWGVLAPAVGFWERPPADGGWVGPGAGVGTLVCLTRKFELRLPQGLGGRVQGVAAARRVAVGFGTLLFDLMPLGDPTQIAGGSAGPGPKGTDLPAGHLALTAPTDGVFYRRASPDAPAFVEVGARVSVGQPVGLVEVMKTFNQIVYGGPGFPAEAQITEIRCGDGEEVALGQTLMVLR